MLTNPWLVAVLLNTILLGIAWIAPKKLLTAMGYLHAWVLGVIVWGSLGWRGYLIVLLYSKIYKKECLFNILIDRLFNDYE
jgi:uncharacterized membrane protein